MRKSLNLSIAIFACVVVLIILSGGFRLSHPLVGRWVVRSGTWVAAFGECWEFRPDGVLLIHRDKQVIEWSYRFNTPDSIHLFYEPHQKAAKGAFLISFGSDTLQVEPAWRYQMPPDYAPCVTVFVRTK